MAVMYDELGHVSKMAMLETETQGNDQLITHIPEEIIEGNILTRLPVQSLVRFSCTCRRWRYLIFSDSKFNKAHFDHTKRPSWKIPVLLYTSRFKKTIDCDFNIETLNPRKTLRSYLRHLVLLGSCNGLLFVGGDRISDGSKEHVLWNPYTNSIKWITLRTKSKTHCYSLSGLSYDRASDDYKALIVLTWGDWRFLYVFSLRRNSWTNISDLMVEMIDWSNKAYGSITLDNGICHWQVEGSSIICFDPVVEKFKDVHLPATLSNLPEKIFRIGSIDGCLSLIHMNIVWVMKEYGCWTKLLVLQPSNYVRGEIDMYKPVGYNSSKDQVAVIAIGERSSCFRIADVENGVMRKPRDNRVSRTIHYAFNVVPYTESLLCPWLGL